MTGSKAPPPPVLVAGMHNSGTSILAETLHLHGLFLGGDGFHHENRFFASYVNNTLIMGGGGNWAKLPVLSVDEVMAFRSKVGPIVHAQWLNEFKALGYDGFSPWGFKDPRVCVLMPLYLELFPEARILHIVRNPDDVAASLSHKKKFGVGLLKDPAHWKELTLKHIERVRSCAEQYPNAYCEVSYEDFCRQPIEVSTRIFEFVGVPMTDKARNFLEQRVHGSRIGKSWRKWLRWKLGSLKRALLPG